MLDRLNQYLPCLESPERWAVATVVDVSGSVPRPVGTSMAVRDDARSIGSISGGCVESAIVDAALECICQQTSALCEFGYTDDDGLVVGLMCGGDITVLIEPLTQLAEALDLDRLDADRLDSTVLIREIPQHVTMRGGGLVETLPADRSGPAVGAFPAACFSADDSLPVTVAAILGRSASIAEEIVRRGGCGIVEVRDESVQDCPTIRRLFVESRRPRARILVYGANDFSSAIAQAAALLGHRVTVCDAREVFATRARHPGADEVIVASPGDHFAAECAAGRVDSRTAVIMLTHDPRFDLPVLDRALRMDLAYVGAMGSRTTHERRAQELLHGGLPRGCFEKLHSPIGLDIGARTPQEVAVAVLAEYVASLHGRAAVQGVPELRHTQGPVHAAHGTDRAVKEPSWT